MAPGQSLLKTQLEKALEVEGLVKSNLKDLKTILKFADVRLQFVSTLHLILKNTEQEQRTDYYLKNALLLTEICLDSMEEPANEPLFNNELGPLSQESPENIHKQFKRSFKLLWFEIMKWTNKPKVVHKKILVLLPEKVLKQLTNPLHMSDYLLSAFELGGPLSLMALQGIFVLMTTYNFEITDFYTRLYSMFTASIFHAKYKARFFAYSSEFLRSTHLPESLVAGFVKRIARLALHAPAPSLPLIFDFITNLIIQHPGLEKMIKRDCKTFEKDPYLHKETCPSKSQGIDSMLWEIKALQNHCVPRIAVHAQFINKPMPKIEVDLDETINLSYDELFEQQIKKKKSYKIRDPNLHQGTPLFTPFPGPKELQQMCKDN